MEPARLGDHVLPWPKHQVVGIAENDLGAVFDEVARLKRLDRAEGANVHEDGGLHHAMSRVQPTQSRVRACIFLEYLKNHRTYCIKKQLPYGANWCIILTIE